MRFNLIAMSNLSTQRSNIKYISKLGNIMQYLIDIRIDGRKKSTFRVDGKNEEQALERLELRLPPQQRDNYIVDSIKIDPASIVDDEPYGIYVED